MSKPTFEESYPEINKIVQSRKSAWTYTSVSEWADLSQILLMRVFEKWSQFDPAKGPLENWVNRLVTNAILNAKRDIGGSRWMRPCCGGGKSNGKSCIYNTGGDSCTYTKSGKQCAECPLFAEWAKTRQHQFNIKSTVALENHAQEVSNLQGDFSDIEGVKEMLDKKMKGELTAWEYHVYRCIYVKHMTPAETGKELEAITKKWKRAPREEERFDYQFILSKQRWCKEMMITILKREGHLDT